MRVNEIDMPWRGLFCMVLLLVTIDYRNFCRQTIETFAGKVKYLHSQKLCKAQQKNKLTGENENRFIFRKRGLYLFPCLFACFVLLRFFSLWLWCFSLALFSWGEGGEEGLC